MSNNPFLEHQKFESKPNRNNYDCSQRCYGTFKIGALYPTALIEVNEGDSVEIDASLLLNAFPMVFPIQTPIRVSFYCFYGRNRALWPDWKDFRFNNKQLVHPYILQPARSDFWKSGELADFLGVPTSYTSLSVVTAPNTGFVTARCASVVYNEELVFGNFSSYFVFGTSINFATLPNAYAALLLGDFNLYESSRVAGTSVVLGRSSDSTASSFEPYTFEEMVSLKSFTCSRVEAPVGTSLTGFQFYYSLCFFRIPSHDEFPDPSIYARKYQEAFQQAIVLGTTSVRFYSFYSEVAQIFTDNFSSIGFRWRDGNTYPNLHDALLSEGFDRVNELRFFLVYSVLVKPSDLGFTVDPGADGSDFADTGVESSKGYSGISAFSELNLVSNNSTGGSAVELNDLDVNPFAGDSLNPPMIPLNALPFRFYEQIYNCYFRDEKNDPFRINGEIEYNKWNTTTASGADSTFYRLLYRNWEADFLTTAQQTPQQGIAPLVGINYRGVATFLNDDGTTAEIRLTTDGNGDIDGIAGEYKNVRKESMRAAMELVQAGISINDFRQVNSYQRWLENNFRRGLKYRDQILAHTGVNIKYDELDMPEFLGGFTRPVQITSVTQSTPSTASDNALGDRAGQAGVFGGSNHKIRKFCDEGGFIMCMICITPQPVYTQLLPKYFLKTDPLSYYSDEFGQIGMQPISYREVCPLQCANLGQDLDATFGYQRPWYDLISATDHAHGQMRMSSMRNYIMNRTFAGVPSLGGSFLHIDPEQLNEVFVATDGTEDVFQGQVYHQIYVKRAIPRFGIPRIE